MNRMLNEGLARVQGEFVTEVGGLLKQALCDLAPKPMTEPLKVKVAFDGSHFTMVTPERTYRSKRRRDLARIARERGFSVG